MNLVKFYVKMMWEQRNMDVRGFENRVELDERLTEYAALGGDRSGLARMLRLTGVQSPIITVTTLVRARKEGRRRR